MNAVRWIELTTLLVVVIVIATQIIVPLVRNRPIFPILRKTAKLEKELGRAEQELEDTKLEKKVSRIKTKMGTTK